jgi:hypothetical protein
MAAMGACCAQLLNVEGVGARPNAPGRRAVLFLNVNVNGAVAPRKRREMPARRRVHDAREPTRWSAAGESRASSSSSTSPGAAAADEAGRRAAFLNVKAAHASSCGSGRGRGGSGRAPTRWSAAVGDSSPVDDILAYPTSPFPAPADPPAPAAPPATAAAAANAAAASSDEDDEEDHPAPSRLPTRDKFAIIDAQIRAERMAVRLKLQSVGAAGPTSPLARRTPTPATEAGAYTQQR